MSTHNSPRMSSTTPVTPTSLRRERNSQFSSTVDDNSPTGSTLSDFATNVATFRLGGGSALRSLSGTPGSQTLKIRSDPSMLTCFDPADKELYDLWAPNR